MARALLKATAISNARLKDGEEPYKLNDGEGLFLFVQRRAKTWLFQYSIANKRGEVTIGRFPDISLAEAREQAQRFRTMVAHGESPAAMKREAIGNPGAVDPSREA